MNFNPSYNLQYPLFQSPEMSPKVHFLAAQSDDTVKFSRIEIPSGFSAAYANYFAGMQMSQTLPSSFLMQGTELSKTYQGFEEHFFTPSMPLIHPVQLTDVQKTTLLARINNFENYKSILHPQNAQNFERTKHGLLDFSIVDGYPDPNLGGYKNFLQKYQNYKNGNFQNMTNEDLAQLLYFTSTTDLVSDGKIGPYAQGRVGSCWMLSMLQNYVSTPVGEQNIANRIKGPDDKGNYTVTFNNPFKQDEAETYTITSDEANNYDLSDEHSAFSSGDIDARLMEIATEKMLKKHFGTDVLPSSSELKQQIDDIKHLLTPDVLAKNSKEDDGNLICSGTFEKRLLLHKALGYKDGIKVYVTKERLNSIIEDYSIPFDPNSTNASIFALNFDFVPKNGKMVISSSVQPTSFPSLSAVLSQGSPSYNFTCGTGQKQYSNDPKENRYISTGHQYNLMQYDSNTASLTVNDPYNSAFPHTIDYSKFDETFLEICEY